MVEFAQILPKFTPFYSHDKNAPKK